MPDGRSLLDYVDARCTLRRLFGELAFGDEPTGPIASTATAVIRDIARSRPVNLRAR